MTKISCVDLFCGAGGLTHGFVLEGVPVVAGIDMDPVCRFPYEANNQARFVERDISKVTPFELKALFGDADLTILAGCAARANGWRTAPGERWSSANELLA